MNAWLFQALYRNSLDMHQEIFAMQADKRFQFYRRYEHLRGQEVKVARFISSLFFDVLLGFGYGIINALVVTCFGIISFAWVIQHHIKVENSDFLKSLYFSVVSFTTVGYGEITAKQEIVPLALTIFFLLMSVAWGALVTAIIVKRIVK